MAGVNSYNACGLFDFGEVGCSIQQVVPMGLTGPGFWAHCQNVKTGEVPGSLAIHLYDELQEEILMVQKSPVRLAVPFCPKHFCPFSKGCLTLMLFGGLRVSFLMQGGPVEILPFLYLGSAYHAARRDMLDALGITALLNVSSDCPNHFEGHYQYKCIPVEDNHKADISSWFMEAIEYIGRLALPQATTSEAGRRRTTCLVSGTQKAL